MRDIESSLKLRHNFKARQERVILILELIALKFNTHQGISENDNKNGKLKPDIKLI